MQILLIQSKDSTQRAQRFKDPYLKNMVCKLGTVGLWTSWEEKLGKYEITGKNDFKMKHNYVSRNLQQQESLLEGTS